MLTFHLHWGQNDMQKWHAAYFEGVAGIKQGGQTRKLQTDVEGQLYQDYECEVLSASRAHAGILGAV